MVRREMLLHASVLKERAPTSQSTVLVFLIRVFTWNDHAECPCLQRSVKLIGLAPRALQDRLGGFGDPVDRNHEAHDVFEKGVSWADAGQ